MNVFSLVPVEKKLFVRNGILDSGADVVAISETKFCPHTAEFKVPGYYQAAAITRKAGAGGLLIMAKNTIRLHSIVVKNVGKDNHIQTIEFEFNKHLSTEAQLSLRVFQKRLIINASLTFSMPELQNLMPRITHTYFSVISIWAL